MFQSYKGTPWAQWLLPIIPVGAKLSENSLISPDKIGKIPGQFYPHNGVWTGFGGWTKISVKEGVLGIWDGWYPKAHQTIGLQTRLWPVIDADVNEEWQAEVVRTVAAEVLGPTASRGRSDGAARCLLLYRLDEAFGFIPKFRRVYGSPECPEFAVEILGKGQQCLIEGIHPKGGRYQWTGPTGGDPVPSLMDIGNGWGSEQVPRINVAQIPSFVRALDEAFELAGVYPIRPKQLCGGDTGGGPDAIEIGPSHPEIAPTHDELMRALSFLHVTDPEFESRGDWQNMCRAMKTAAGGNEDFYSMVYLQWNLDGGLNDHDDIREMWEGHSNSRLGWDYIVNVAAKRGYVSSVEGLFDDLDNVVGEPAGITEPGTAQEHPRYRGPVPKPMPEDFSLQAIPRRPFVLGHRFMAGTVTLGVGAPGAGKSNLSILTALAIATGHPLTGEKVHRTGPVWIHNNEDSLDELNRRIAGMLKCLGIELDQFRQNILRSSGLDERLIVAFKSKDIVRRTEAVADVITAIKEYGIVHMVIDPLVSTHLGVSENSNEEIEQVIGTIQHIAHETGCSIDLVHHSLKSHSHNTEVYAGDPNAARGASSLIGAARMVYTVAPMSEQTAKNWHLGAAQAARLLRLDHGKGNYATRDTAVRWFELETFEIGNGDYFPSEGNPVLGDTVAVPKLWKPPADRAEVSEAVEHAGKLQQVRDVVGGAMSSGRCPASELFPAIMQELSVKESTARALLKEAIPEGEEVTAGVGMHTYLLKIEREKPSPPGRLIVVRRREVAPLAEAA